MTKYFKEVTNEETGEVTELSTVTYLNGCPKEFRFDGKNGYFKMKETPILTDKGKAINTFEFVPIAFRVFEENLFGRNKKDLWFELFFIHEHKNISGDTKPVISMIMFNNTSAIALQELQRELFYEDLSICDVLLKITTKEKENDKGKWFQAQFDYEPITAEEREELKEIEQLLKPHCSATLTDTAVYSVYEGSFFHAYVPTLAENKDELLLTN